MRELGRVFVKGLVYGLGFAIGLSVLGLSWKIYYERESDRWVREAEEGWAKTKVTFDRLEEDGTMLYIVYTVTNESGRIVTQPSFICKISDRGGLLLSRTAHSLEVILMPGQSEQAVLEIEKTERIPSSDGLLVELGDHHR